MNESGNLQMAHRRATHKNGCSDGNGSDLMSEWPVCDFKDQLSNKYSFKDNFSLQNKEKHVDYFKILKKYNSSMQLFE